MSYKHSENHYDLLGQFIGFDLSSEKHMQTEVIDSEYMHLLPTITAATKKSFAQGRKKLKNMEDIVFDGNVPQDGASPNEDIAQLQQYAFKIMQDIAKKNDFNAIDKMALNSVFLNTLSATNQDETYYQSVYKDKKNNVVSSKISNILVHPSKVLGLLKDAYLLGTIDVDNSLLLFCWTFLELLKNFVESSKIELTINQVIVLIYIQKYITLSISEDELVSHIENKKLHFYVNEKINDNITISKDDVHKAINDLMYLRIISMEDNNIKIIESILL